jgi:PAS domain S-box-containing protein
MSKESEEIKRLQAENEDLQARLDEAEETLRAIRSGEVDALVVNDREGAQIYTLQGAEQPYRVMVDNMFAGACTTTEDGTIIYSNEHFAGMLKVPLEKVTGNSIMSLVSDEDKARLEALFKLANAVRISEEIKLRAPDGSEVPTYLSINTVPADHTHVTIVAIDLTERKRAEAESRSLQKLESLRVLAGGIAHDLNNLMVAIMGNAGLALHALPPGSPAWEYVADIEKSTEKVTNFSKQILSFTSKVPPKKEPVQLNDIVNDTAHFLMASISKRVEIDYSLSDDLPAILAEPQNMQQIVMNLIINASDAIGDNKGTIKVSTGKMYADRKYLDSLYKNGVPEGEYVYVEVADTGCGMSPETRKRIFEPFFTTKFTGRGIGLSAVFGIVNAHGGTIALESEGGCGATFKVLLPVPENPVEAAATKTVSEDVWHGKGTILVCDDEKDSLLMAKKVLEGAGYNVLTAMDGAEAIKIFNKKKDSISAVILDLIMPHVRGDEAAKEIRKIRPDVNILLLSGYHEIDLSEIGNGQGNTATLEKPYKITKLLRAVQDILKD